MEQIHIGAAAAALSNRFATRRACNRIRSRLSKTDYYDQVRAVRAIPVEDRASWHDTHEAEYHREDIEAALLTLAEVRQDGATTEATNSGLALMGAIAPRDELEAALAVQMVATHELAMLTLTRARNADYIDAMKEYGNLATKLSRTFTGQMKELADWRRGGEQVVRHVHVYEGGQAMVAQTIQIAGQNAKTAEPPHALGPAMLGYDQARNGVSITSDPRQEAVSHARGQEPRRSGQSE